MYSSMNTKKWLPDEYWQLSCKTITEVLQWLFEQLAICHHDDFFKLQTTVVNSFFAI